MCDDCSRLPSLLDRVEELERQVGEQKPESISLKPLSVEAHLALPEREQMLQHIGDNIAHWIAWVTSQYKAEGVPVSQDTHIMLPGENAPPHWPSVGQLTKWLEIIRQGTALEGRG